MKRMTVMKSKHLITIILILFAFASFAQKGNYIIDENSNWQDRVYFGSGFGMSSDSWGTSVSLSPIVGYMFTNRVSAGVGATYEYYWTKGIVYDYSDNRWGGLVFGRVNLVRQIFAYGEYSFLNYSYLGDKNDRRTVARLPVGLGLSQPIGPRSALNIIAAYDLIYNENSPYASPWVFNVYFSL
ncbi:MAG: hypothetical protein ABFS32_10740 [Bacteroidota bacterium]